MRAFWFLVLLSASVWRPIFAADAQPWVARSNAAIQPALDYISRFSPEEASFLGLEDFDGLVVDLNPRVFERSQAEARKVIELLRARINAEKEPRVRQDLQIAFDALSDRAHSDQLQHELMLPYTDAPRLIFEGVRALLDDRNPFERKKHAVARLQRYAGLVEGQDPVTVLARARTQERFEAKGLTGPYAEELRKNLDSSERYLSGLADLFRAAQLSGWEEAHVRLVQQCRDYGAWLKAEILPRARPTNRLPEAIYEDNLKSVGVRMPPRELMERARFGFLEIRDEMQAIAQRLAAERHLASGDYRDVLRELKKAQITGDKILPFYQGRLREVEQIIREHDLVTLPDRKASIRLASEAESSAQPAPHMNPPRLIGNRGEYGEFVLPLTNPTADSKAAQDDFTNDPFAWTLVAHEARPGHELQFAGMVEKGISLARAFFAFNSANAEGWGLYSEAIMKEYMPLDGQLFSLQARLQRAARAFLDPMLNLGEMEPVEAKRFLMREVGLSEPFATQEVDRYTFRAPGQATSYYYGYLKIRELRARTELALGGKFKPKAFHDFILGQGLLPPEVLSQAVVSEFIPQSR